MADGIRIVDQHARLGHTDAKHWLFRVWDPRRKKWKSKAWDKLTDGHRWAAEIRARFNLRLSAAGKLSFAAVADDYIDSMTERGLKAVHVREVRLVCDAVLAAGAVDLLADDFASTVRKWLANAPTFAKGRQTAPGNVTKNRWLRHLKGACQHAVRHQGLNASPLHSVKRLKVDQRLKATLRIDELRAVVAPAMDVLPPFYGPADPYFLPACLLVYAGLRGGEALFARWEWVDFDAQVIVLRTTPEYPIKRNKERAVPLLDELREILLLRYPGRDAKGYIVDCDWLRGLENKGRWLAFRSYLEHCGLDARDLHPHATRHTWASLMLATGASPMWVRRALGHESLTTTDGYSNAEAQFGAVVRGWTRGQFYLRRPAPGTVIEDPLAWLREFTQAGGSVDQVAAASGVPAATLTTWLREGPPEAVRQLVAARHAAQAVERRARLPVAASASYQNR